MNKINISRIGKIFTNESHPIEFLLYYKNRLKTETAASKQVQEVAAKRDWTALGGRNVFAGHRSAYLPLTRMHKSCILIHMRTTLNIDDEILEKASRLTGIKEKTALVRLGLEALIARESSKRLAKLGGTEKDLRPIRRRRSAKSLP